VVKRRRSKLLNDRRHTAIHEAGHAVVGRVLTLIRRIMRRGQLDTVSPPTIYECEHEWPALLERPSY
jgi:hypothetical protein